MFKLTNLCRFACATALCLASFTAEAEPSSTTAPAPTVSAKATTAVKSGRQTIQGITYYYEIRGKGEPLLLLHGLGSIDMFGPVLDRLAESRLVIAVDLQGHGRTALGTRPFRLETIADDMATLVKRLGHPKATATCSAPSTS
jgi:hypothetical protein